MAKKKQTKATKPKKVSLSLSKQNKIVLGSFIIIVSIFLLFAFTSYFINWKDDQSALSEFAVRNSEVKNIMSKFGAAISHFFIFRGFGLASYILIGLFAYYGLVLFLNLKNQLLLKKSFWGLLYMLWISLFLSMITKSQSLLGGMVGFEINDFLQDYIGLLGIILLLIFGMIVILVIRFKLTPDKVISQIQSKIQALKKEFEQSKQKTKTPEPFISENQTKEPHIEQKAKTPPATEKQLETEIPLKKEEEPILINKEIALSNEISAKEEIKESFQVERAKEEELDENSQLAAKLVTDFGEFDPTLDLSHYAFPTIDLLEDHGGAGSITINQEELENNKNKIVETLRNYKIGIAQIKATIGPTVTLYEIIPEAGIRISKIKNLEDDIALSLSALGIRIIAPIPGKGTIGIEVPNKKPAIVPMRAVVSSPKFINAEMQLPVAIGKTISNETFVVDLAKMPHLLMAGATGQGKSVGLNAILTSLLYKKHPAEVKFVLVDPKKVELTLFNKIERHFLAKLPDSEDAIITDNTKVINTLNSLCIEMDHRYDLLKEALVRNIAEYNTKFKARKLNPNDGHKFLPYIVLVIDEFADLIITAGKEVETPISRLAQLARAIGIHLIIATQRPSVNVITGIIKANFPARIAFRVTSKIDSRTILDGPGADQLIGRGDMLYTQGSDLVRLQCAFVDTPEVERITEFIGSQRAYATAHMLPEYVGEESNNNLDISKEDRDAMFAQAAEVIVTAQQGSASLLQRKLKLGYNRAGRIIDQLEAAGIVGPFEGSKARQVLIPDLTALEQFLNNE
ncbi:MAG: DNA translocase FtsK [Flavobacteriaceae bacterium]|nr:DNA translocase FtsK [Flavobacteriaceae bacterium]